MALLPPRLQQWRIALRVTRRLLRSSDPELARWLRSFDSKRSPLDDESAWVTCGALRWLNENLRPDQRVYEYGSGGSTLFFARRVGAVVSVEHDQAWHQMVQRRLRDKAIANCSCTLHMPVPVPGADLPYAPGSYGTTDEQWAGHSFENYVRSIEPQPDASFDLVLVDGRSRASCLLAALPKVKPGGWLMLDNSERSEYQAGIARVPHTHRIDFYGPGPYNNYMWTTSAFRIGNG